MASGQKSIKKAKAQWTLPYHKVFVELCFEQTLNGNRPGTHLTKEGWQNIVDLFHKKTGLKYEKKQMKNHWDVTKEQWKAWRKIIATSYMRYDSDTHTFGASEEDWANYLEANPEAAPFRFKELPFSEKLDSIFAGTVSGEIEPRPKRKRQNDVSATSFSHIRERKIPLRDKLVDVLPQTVDSGETEPLTKGKRQNDSSTTNPSPSKEQILMPLLCCKTDLNCDAVESRSGKTVQSERGRRSYSIGECIECLDSMEEVEQGSELYLFALDVFLRKDYREIFLQLKKPGLRVAWLQRLQSVGQPSEP